MYNIIWVETASAGRLYFLTIDKMFEYLNQYNDVTSGYVGIAYD